MLSLPAAERRLLVKATILLMVTKFCLWLLPFALVRRLSGGLVRAPFRVRDEEYPQGKVVWAVETAGRGIPRFSTCLTLALASQVLLGRRGHPALVLIGVVGGGGSDLEAHAWVQSGGKVLVGGTGIERYTILATLEAN